jgi:hypothetical protein
VAFAQGKINDMYERALTCLDAEFTDIPKDSGGDLAARGLREAFAVIREAGSSQAGFGDSAQAGTGERSAARVSVREYRKRLAWTANVITRKKAGFNRDFPLPYGETDDELITHTRAVAAKAVANEADFTLRGLTNEYIASGTALVDAFEAALNATNTALSHRGAATGSKKSAYREADENFDELDIYIRNSYADQPDKINAWRNATHIERSAAKQKEENPPEENQG